MKLYRSVLIQNTRRIAECPRAEYADIIYKPCVTETELGEDKFSSLLSLLIYYVI